eukprot:5564212-Pleurochrysis_carterae.AAC.1
MIIVVLLEEVARVELGLGETLDFDELLLGGSVPNASGVGLTIEWLEQLPDDGDASVVEVALVWR